MSDKNEPKDGKKAERSEAEVRASALAGEVAELKGHLAASRKEAAAAAEQLRSERARAEAAEKAAAEAQGRLADIETNSQVVVLAVDRMVGGVPKAVRSRLALVQLEPGVELSWLADALAAGVARAK